MSLDPTKAPPGPDAKYVKLLNEARKRARNPTYRDIGDRAGISQSTTHRIMTGQIRPYLRNLQTLVVALVGDDEDAAQEIYDAFGVPELPSRKAEEPSDAELIADAIRYVGDVIAEAIRDTRR